ncbi:MAG: type II toxin-antitoxin system HicA family toxin [Myxococcaceae bacterium]
MGVWPSKKAKVVLRALLKIGWSEKRNEGTSHRVLQRPGFEDYTWAFHDGVEIGPKMMAKIAKKTGLVPTDL